MGCGFRCVPETSTSSKVGEMQYLTRGVQHWDGVLGLDF